MSEQREASKPQAPPETVASKTRADDNILNLAKQVLAQHKEGPNKRKDQENEDVDDAPIVEADLNLKAVEELTKKLAQDLGTGFLDSDDEDDEKQDDGEEDDAEFRKQLLSEFRTLKQQSGDASNAISKQRLKQLYLQLLKSGPNIMSDRTMADQFLAKLDSQEITALMDILRMDPEETMNFFNKDPEVVDAIKNKVPLFPASASGQNKWDLSEQDLLDSDDEEDDTSPMSDAVQEAIKVFEENLASYTRNPAAILSLCDKLNDKDQQQFLNYIFKNYTPDKIENKLKQKQQKQESKQPQAPPIPQEVLDHNLVSHVFKEVFTHFRAYKKQPHKFKPLIDRLNPGEQKAFDALVKAFWDLSVDKLKL